MHQIEHCVLTIIMYMHAPVPCPLGLHAPVYLKAGIFNKGSKFRNLVRGPITNIYKNLLKICTLIVLEHYQNKVLIPESELLISAL